jgi:MoaA/NifB/PqqE/SkfB family radical SAM enzyme
MEEPRRIWWARPRKLCLLERPGGGGRSHRPERRVGEIAYLAEHGVRLVVSTMTTRHNLGAYEDAGLAWHHVPVQGAGEGADALEELLPFLRRELRRRGAVAVHGNRHTDFVAAVGAAHLYESRGLDPAEGLRAAGDAGLVVTPEACALLGVPYEAVQPRSRMASSTSSGLSVTT